jgi:hypothetical protein
LVFVEAQPDAVEREQPAHQVKYCDRVKHTQRELYAMLAQAVQNT